MKIVLILVIGLLTFGNHFKLMAQPVELNSHIKLIENIDQQLEKITVYFQNPIRDIDLNLKNFSHLTELYNQFLIYNINLSSRLLNKVKKNETLTGDELYSLRRTALSYYKLNKKILDFANIYDIGSFRISQLIASESRNIRLVKAQLIWLTGHLLVIDHFETMHTLLYEEDGAFRRIVKNALLDNSSNDEMARKNINELLKIRQLSVEVSQSLKFIQQITLIRAIQPDLLSLLAKEKLTLFLVQTIDSNQTAKDISLGKISYKFESHSFIDSLVDILNNMTGHLSHLFGTVAGSVKWRKGHFYKNKMALSLAIKNLRPMDILIEKSPFTLTDQFIPGHFGHAAIYLGTKDQLKSINMWSHPDIIPYHTEIEKGQIVLEAVRPGVRLNSLEEFLNIDELTIMRKEDGLKNPELLMEEMTRGMEQIGKDYDYNFDVESLDKIVCSELIYITYGTVLWPTHYRFGRVTITPDDIAEVLFFKNSKFKLQQYLVAREARHIELVNLDHIADEFDYEKRTKNGEPIKDESDLANSYWKKETKCYNVAQWKTNQDSPQAQEAMIGSKTKRICKIRYKENLYEEKDYL
jgi:hypothetical protein